MAELFRASKLDGSGAFRMIVADTEAEALDLLEPDEVLVRHVPEAEARKRRLDKAMDERVRRDEEATARRHDEAQRRFVDELTREVPTTRLIDGAE